MNTKPKQPEKLLDELDSIAQPVRLGHRRALDGLRGAGSIIVLGNHAAGSHFPGGGIALDSFFVLSGFLITRLLFEEWRDTGRISIRDFYWRRAFRLLPALLLVLLFVLAAPRLLSDVGQMRQYINLRDIVAPLTYTSNWVLISHFNDPNLMPHAWSLAVEEQFYLLWPLALVLLLRKWPSPSALLRATGILIALATIVMVIRASLGTPTIVLLFGSENRSAIMLLTGTMLAFWFERTDQANSRLMRFARFAWIPAVAATTVFVVTMTQHKRFLYYGGWLVVMVIVATLLIAALNERTLFSRILSTRHLVWLGTISYSLYLWQMPIIIVANNFLRPHGYGSEVVAAVAVPVSFLLAVLSTYLVERPINRMGRSWLARRRTAQSH